jgi:hypothetical protein
LPSGLKDISADWPVVRKIRLAMRTPGALASALARSTVAAAELAPRQAAALGFPLIGGKQLAAAKAKHALYLVPVALPNSGEGLAAQSRRTRSAVYGHYPSGRIGLHERLRYSRGECQRHGHQEFHVDTPRLR